MTDPTEPLSKTAIKRIFKEQQAFVRQLIAAPQSHLTQLGLSERVMEELQLARSLSKSALKRQVGYLSKLMDDSEIAVAREKLASLQQPDAEANARFHQLESWREQLLLGDDTLIDKLVNEFDADRQQLRTLVRKAKKEHQQGGDGSYLRQLFRYLRQISEEIST